MRTKRSNQHKKPETGHITGFRDEKTSNIKNEENQYKPYKRNIISFETPSWHYKDKNGNDDFYGW